MKMFEQVIVPDSKQGNDYTVTAEINQVTYDDREGPYYFVESTAKGKGRKLKKANFKRGKFYHYSEVIKL